MLAGNPSARFSVKRGCGSAEAGIKAALMHVDTDAHNCKRNRAALGVRFNQDAACLSRTYEQIVRPA